MTKLITVQFLIPDADNDKGISEEQELKELLQDAYDHGGVPGSFLITDSVHRNLDESYLLDQTRETWNDMFSLRYLNDDQYPNVRFGTDGPNSSEEGIDLTEAQKIALFRKWRQNHNNLPWPAFAAKVQITYQCDDAVVVEWCGMWLVIEKDGHAHS